MNETPNQQKSETKFVLDPATGKTVEVPDVPNTLEQSRAIHQAWEKSYGRHI